MNVEPYALLTPEKVVVSYRLAGIGSRIIAHLTDLIVLFFVLAALNMVGGFLALAVGPEGAMAIAVIANSIAVFAYFFLQEGYWQGQTLGKRAAGLRVVMVDGTPITWEAAVFRNLLRPADFLPALYLVGVAAIFTNARSQRVGDLAAGTVVIHTPKADLRFSPAPHRYGTHPLEASIGELRSMSLEEYVAIKRLCDRFPELPPEIQARSVAEIWQPFAAHHGIEPIEGVHPVYQMEAVVMKFGRLHKLV